MTEPGQSERIVKRIILDESERATPLSPAAVSPRVGFPSAMHGASLLEWSDWYWDTLGWMTIPVWGKVPRFPNEMDQPAIHRINYNRFYRRMPTNAQRRRLFLKRWTVPPTGLALLLGFPSNGAWSRDFDSFEAMLAWAQDHPEAWLTLPRVLNRRGCLLVGRWVEPINGTSKKGDGELRGTGQYILLPPSIHPDTGLPYAWAIDPVALPCIHPRDLGLDQRWGTEQAGTMHQARAHEPFSEPVWQGKVPDTVGEIVTSCLPSGLGQSQGAGLLFNLARLGKHWLATHPEADVTPETFFSLWYEGNRFKNPCHSRHEYAQQFHRAWDRVNTSVIGRSLQAAWEDANDILCPSELTVLRDPAERLTAMLMRALQRMNPSPLFLSKGKLAELLHCHPNTAKHILQRLVRYGIVEVVSGGTVEIVKAGLMDTYQCRATFYRYLGLLTDPLEERVREEWSREGIPAYQYPTFPGVEGDRA